MMGERPESEERTCEHCRWWDVAEAVAFTAECRRYPPAPSWRLGQNGIDFSQGSFPVISGLDWCGEFSARPAPTDEPRE